jgi:hypothetical protein
MNRKWTYPLLALIAAAAAVFFAFMAGKDWDADPDDLDDQDEQLKADKNVKEP